MKKTILLVLCYSMILLSCKNKQETNTEDSLKQYPVFTLQQIDTALALKYVAEIQARKNVEIRSRLNGILHKIYVDEGQHVTQGQLLFSMNDEELQIALNKANAILHSAQADAKVAKVEMERVQLLVDKKIVASTELELAEAKYHAAKAKIEEASSEKAAALKRLSYTKIYAPFDGVIDRLPLKAGSVLTEGSLLTTLSDIHSMLAYFHVSETEYLQYIKNHEKDSLNIQAIQLILSDGSHYPYSGKIVASESEIDENTGSIAFRADFPNPKHILRHGASANILIPQSSMKVILVPQKSVMEIQDKYYVYVLDAQNIAHMKAFKPLNRIQDYYIVTEDLQANERIVFEGIQNLREGEKIAVEQK